MTTLGGVVSAGDAMAARSPLKRSWAQMSGFSTLYETWEESNTLSSSDDEQGDSDGEVVHAVKKPRGPSLSPSLVENCLFSGGRLYCRLRKFDSLRTHRALVAALTLPQGQRCDGEGIAAHCPLLSNAAGTGRLPRVDSRRSSAPARLPLSHLAHHGRL